TLNLANTSGNTISGSAITLDVNAVSAAINVGAGNNSISSNLVLNDDTDVNAFGSGATLTISGVISGAGAFSKTGAGLVTISGSNTYSGGTNVTGSTLKLGASGSL